MHIRQQDFAGSKNETRHYRLFELLRQSAAHTGTNRTAQASSNESMNLFRDMACASLRH